MNDIPQLLAQPKRPVFSFEFFLPKAPTDIGMFIDSVKALKSLDPDFITLTYGAGGTDRARTVEAAGRLQKETGLTTACHLTCIAHSRVEISAILDRLHALDIRHIVALRGDPPKGAAPRPVSERDYAHASDLVADIRDRGRFKVAVAAYPEKHPEARSAADDMTFFTRKAQAGADWAITQLFFDARHYFDFVRRARSLGSMIPIVPGIMPVTGYAQLCRFTAMCGATIPPELDERLAAVQEDAAAVTAVGVEWATRQCRLLLEGGAPGIHFYTLNRSHSTAEILSRLRSA